MTLFTIDFLIQQQAQKYQRCVFASVGTTRGQGIIRVVVIVLVVTSVGTTRGQVIMRVVLVVATFF